MKSSTQVSVTCGALKDTLNGQKQYIKGSSSEIKDENITLTTDLLIETVGNGSSSGLVDDMEEVHA